MDIRDHFILLICFPLNGSHTTEKITRKKRKKINFAIRIHLARDLLLKIKYNFKRNNILLKCIYRKSPSFVSLPLVRSQLNCT